MKYPKINTLWKRDEENKHNIIPGDYSDPEFENIKKWHVTEKIDGTNIRIFWDGDCVRVGGRTDNAQIPTNFLDYFQDAFSVVLFKEAFPDVDPYEDALILFGEGYGVKIQKGGGLYRPDASFILFDVNINGMWLTRESVEDIGKKMGIDVVPTLGIWTIEEIVNHIKSQPHSEIAKLEKIAEGIVARSHPLMLYRNGKPLMFKLKVKDYTKLEEK